MTIRTSLTLTVDSFDSRGNRIGTLLAMRASAEPHDAHDVVSLFLDGHDDVWRQMTYAEVLHALAEQVRADGFTWEQLSIF